MTDMLSKPDEAVVPVAETSAGTTPPAVKPAEDRERWKNLIVVLTIINTVIIAIIAGLQSDATIRANAANRDSQYYALLASGELVRQGLQSSYDIETVSKAIRYQQESYIMQFSELMMQTNDTPDTAATTLQALVAQSRADTIKAFSIFYTDPRYAPASEDALPNTDTYIADQTAIVNEIVAQQNAASDDYHTWSSKGDSYVAVLTVLSVAFFLLGIGQSVSRPRLRFFFAILGLLVIFIGLAWSALVVIS